MLLLSLCDFLRCLICLSDVYPEMHNCIVDVILIHKNIKKMDMLIGYIYVCM
ncbi:hypothetical protein ES319_A08G016500v1 [Gossypium barbadense]|uniref:Uncharacterized protein n=2 Tax=Gossypium TaxID=3633 RepID=A0A5J5UJQ0_GOSBA|nr:hypothetical protein ES319_A08G016500v1 [Gossypium barbadense]TYH04587.1 hypothetical protein ES288_A08G018800v1 [Gossypium darwinii]